MVPEELTFYQERMRGHLQFCLEDKLKHRKCSVKTLKTEIVQVFCKCRRQEKGEIKKRESGTVPGGAWSDAVPGVMLNSSRLVIIVLPD